MKINIRAIIYNHTIRYWYMWTYRGPEYNAYKDFIHRRVHWNTWQNKKYLKQYVDWMNTQS